MEAEAREMILIWYKEGRMAFILGRNYEPPDNVLLRRSYAEGWQDEINGVWPEDQEVLSSIFGV